MPEKVLKIEINVDDEKTARILADFIESALNVIGYEYCPFIDFRECLDEE